MKRNYKFLAALLSVIMLSSCSFGSLSGCRAKAGSDNSDISVGDSSSKQEIGEESSANPAPTEEQNPPEQQEPDANTESGGGDGSNPSSDMVIILIQGDKVFVDGVRYDTKEDFRLHIEELNEDPKIFILEEENSILATYEWVVEELQSLEIEIISSLPTMR